MPDEGHEMSQGQAHKTLSVPEVTSMVAFAATALLCLYIASGSVDPAYSFHVYLFAAGSIGAIFALGNRYMGRPVTIPQEIDGKPNYNMAPVQFAVVAAVFWGIAGFTVGLIIASQLAWPALNFDLPWINFGRLRPLHTSAVIFAFGGNVLLATSFYVVQKT